MISLAIFQVLKGLAHLRIISELVFILPSSRYNLEQKPRNINGTLLRTPKFELESFIQLGTFLLVFAQPLEFLTSCSCISMLLKSFGCISPPLSVFNL